MSRVKEVTVQVTIQKEPSSLVHAVAGGLGGMVSMALTYPLANLTTNAQAKGDKEVEKEAKEDEKKIKDIKDKREKIKALLKEIKGSYGGLSTAMLGIVATNFVYYYFYELTGQKLKARKGLGASLRGLSAKESILAGLVGGIVSRIVTNPIWVANTRMAVAKGQTGSLFHVMYGIVKNEGWKKLFAGLSPALALVFNPVIQYTIFEQLKTLVVSRTKRPLTALDALYLGAFGKMIAALVTYPWYTVRSRMHMNTDKKQKGLVELVKEIYQKEGLGKFYDGLSLKLVQGIISAAFLFYFKEQFVLQAQYLLRRLKKA